MSQPSTDNSALFTLDELEAIEAHLLAAMEAEQSQKSEKVVDPSAEGAVVSSVSELRRSWRY